MQDRGLFGVFLARNPRTKEGGGDPFAQTRNRLQEGGDARLLAYIIPGQRV